MDNTPQNRDYSTISPSAKALLLMKGFTNIPYARSAAELISLPASFQPDDKTKDFSFWARTVHFEYRYRSIDHLLTGLDTKNILELSSGFSFRGLDTVMHHDVYYIDTDLPEIIEKKKELVNDLQQTDEKPIGVLELLSLNALDEEEFKATVNRFPAGPVAIVNEGLLMYLGIPEKKKLCAIIHDVLKERGGYWITADIYLKESQGQQSFELKDDLQKFLDAHNIEENKFDSIEAAEAFFREAGFVVDKEDVPDYQSLSTFNYFMQSLSEEHLSNLGKTERIQATWRLRLADQ